MALSSVLPDSWRAANGLASVGGVELAALADEFGTPVYVVDEAHLQARLDQYREAFGSSTTLIYAAKAFLCRALAARLNEAGWWVDVVSVGELEIARGGGVDPSRILMHGNAKPQSEVARAIEQGVARVVVDHPGELEVLAGSASEAASAARESTAGAGGARREVDILLRLNADVAAVTHPKVKTTGLGAQFGMDARTAADLVAEASRWPGIRFRGVHIHVGSQIVDLSTYQRSAEAAVDFLEPFRDRFVGPVEMDLGGGLAVPYVRTDTVLTPAALAEAVFAGLDKARARQRLGDHRLLVEPGRSVVANAGVTLYRAQARKMLPDGREVVAVDGGMTDNLRPALYAARYEVLCAERTDAPHDHPFRVVGRHCETGDVVAEGALLPDDTGPGELLAVPVTGAYGYSMSSRYNGVRRPPVVFVRDGVAHAVVRRETFDDLLACDLG
jgi:diaminopimelate decarboxylase